MGLLRCQQGDANAECAKSTPATIVMEECSGKRFLVRQPDYTIHPGLVENPSSPKSLIPPH